MNQTKPSVLKMAPIRVGTSSSADLLCERIVEAERRLERVAAAEGKIMNQPKPNGVYELDLTQERLQGEAVKQEKADEAKRWAEIAAKAVADSPTLDLEALLIQLQSEPYLSVSNRLAQALLEELINLRFVNKELRRQCDRLTREPERLQAAKE